MKHIKLFEAWSSKFNRTLQGASAIATSTNKGFGRAAKSVRDYAERQISEEKFTLELEDGSTVILTPDPDFLLHPVDEFITINKGISDRRKSFFLPVKLSKNTAEGSPALKIKLRTSIAPREKLVLMFRDVDPTSNPTSKSPFLNASIILGPRESFNRAASAATDVAAMDNSTDLLKNLYVGRFSDRAGLENFMAMSVQAVLTSPEPGFSASSTWVKNEPSQIGMETLPEGMTQEKFDILRSIQDVILKRDIREFIM